MINLHAQSKLDLTEQQLMVLIKQHLNESYIEKFKYKDFPNIEAFRHSLKTFDEKRGRELATQSKRRAAMAPVIADSLSTRDPIVELRLKTLENSLNTLAETQASNLKQIANVASGSNAETVLAPSGSKKDIDSSKNRHMKREYAPCSYCNRPGHYWRICRIKRRDEENQRGRNDNRFKRRFNDYRSNNFNEPNHSPDKKPATSNGRPDRSREVPDTMQGNIKRQ